MNDTKGNLEKMFTKTIYLFDNSEGWGMMNIMSEFSYVIYLFGNN